MTTAHSMLGELDEALVTGTRALEIAGRLGDLRLRILTTTYLEQAHYFRGEYERVVELATENLAALPADWVYENFGNITPASVYDRCWLVTEPRRARQVRRSGRRTRPKRSGLPSRRSMRTPSGLAHRAAGMLYLLKGDWAKARALIEHGIAVVPDRAVVLMFPARRCLRRPGCWRSSARRTRR